MRNLENYFKDRKINYDRLIEYGFILKEDNYYYEKIINDGVFKIVIEINKQQKIAKVIDLLNDQEYNLVDVKGVTGNFVGKIKEIYEALINDIIDKCSNVDVFKSKQTIAIINYVKAKYDNDLEFLWKKSPKNAIWRNQNNRKWYGAVLVISKDKLKIESNEMVEILDLRYQKNDIKNIIDNYKIFPGYHMNKDNWITIILDGRVELEEIYQLIDNSYQLSLHK
ncbi:MAG TPA: MmcQ/YjbR family DNA-binding protein [Candidatus Erysipelatoclostridium merdavium]|uniref:MmcQ/YjbR family DNA-binding protein n=1 Tax=Candidatus Erysipelatoclostridium merdavium TaxID=2838566 RepID=A0A9D1XJ90_9FIRM|nr:MmcQ/YjbR family DNA-binding protein [Candidatus Erysipelatoclostridium merdavium]